MNMYSVPEECFPGARQCSLSSPLFFFFFFHHLNLGKVKKATKNLLTTLFSTWFFSDSIDRPVLSLLPTLSPLLVSSPVHLDLWCHFDRLSSEGVCSATSTRKQTGQLLVLKYVIYNTCICLITFGFGLKREVSGESMDLSWNKICCCFPNILCLWFRIIQLKGPGNFQKLNVPFNGYASYFLKQ